MPYLGGGGFKTDKFACCAGARKFIPTSNEAFVQPKPSVAMQANFVPTLPYSTNTSCEPVRRCIFPEWCRCGRGRFLQLYKAICRQASRRRHRGRNFSTPATRAFGAAPSRRDNPIAGHRVGTQISRIPWRSLRGPQAVPAFRRRMQQFVGPVHFSRIVRIKHF